MAKQADIEFLYILALEHYREKCDCSNAEVAEIFNKNHVFEKMLVQHEYLHQIALSEVFAYVESLVSENATTLVLYHGSDKCFEAVDLTKANDYRDFGKGFYTTVLDSQAKEWAYRLSLRNGTKSHYVYRFSYTPSDDLNIKHFDSMSIEWLDFIKENRSKGGIQHNYDVVIGPVADDKTVQTVQLYLLGTINADEAMNRLKFNKVNNQISFHTEKGLNCLKLKRWFCYE